MSDSPLCRDERRRSELFRHRDILGIDFVEVLSPTQLCVHLFGDVPPVRDAKHPHGITIGNVAVRGGRRIRDLQVVDVRREPSGDEDRDDCLRVTVDREGDFSTYELCLVGLEHVDPRYACASFSFRLDCPTGLDCAPVAGPPAPWPPTPQLNYLAKDYGSLRQLILDRLAVTLPGWQERHAADVGIALVELLAYAGDHLSYYQDAVATEAYLGTARRRISVRRHARLVDYVLHEGLNARTWVTVWTSADTPPVAAGDLVFVPAADLPADGALPASVLDRMPAAAALAFEPLGDPGRSVVFRERQNTIRLYTWGGDVWRLDAGATAATLCETEPPLGLRAGDLLVLEEVKSPQTGAEADADRLHRHVVRLTKVTRGTDELLGTPIVDVTWATEDALPFPLCLQTRLPAPSCTLVEDVSVARGNVLLVDHGLTRAEELDPVGVATTVGDCSCPGAVDVTTEIPARFTPTLPRTPTVPVVPLTWAEPLDAGLPAVAATRRDPVAALPQLRLTAPDGDVWTPRPDLLSSGPDDPHVVVETDDDGVVHLRFGDGELGRLPQARLVLTATYRTGNGTAGNVGADSLTGLVVRSQSWSGLDVRPRNPLPATGGEDPEPTARAKLLAPHAFRSELRRAVTADDYAQLAAQRPGVQGAAAELEWTGSWFEAHVAVDALGEEVADQSVLTDVRRALRDVRRMGHDLAVRTARLVPLDLAVTVCVDPHHSRGAVRAAVQAVLGTGRTSSGALGLFAPDNLTFGTSVRVSRIVAAVRAVEGVTDVQVTTLQRLDEGDAGELAAGVLTVHDLEIAQLDADPNQPENGRLALTMEGGR